jgi:hypothetical protein
MNEKVETNMVFLHTSPEGVLFHLVQGEVGR